MDILDQLFNWYKLKMCGIKNRPNFTGIGIDNAMYQNVLNSINGFGML